MNKPLHSFALVGVLMLLAVVSVGHVAFGQVTDDFTMTANPDALRVARGSTATSLIVLNPVGGFVGSVTLTASISPARPHPPAVSLDPTSVLVCAPCASLVVPTSTLTVTGLKNTMKGTYLVAVTGTSGSTAHTIIVSVTVTS